MKRTNGTIAEHAACPNILAQAGVSVLPCPFAFKKRSPFPSLGLLGGHGMLDASAVSWAMGITKGVGGVPPGRGPGFLQSPVDGGPDLVRSLPTSCGDGSGEASAEAMGAAPFGARASRLLKAVHYADA